MTKMDMRDLGTVSEAAKGIFLMIMLMATIGIASWALTHCKIQQAHQQTYWIEYPSGYRGVFINAGKRNHNPAITEEVWECVCDE